MGLGGVIPLVGGLRLLAWLYGPYRTIVGLTCDNTWLWFGCYPGILGHFGSRLARTRVCVHAVPTLCVEAVSASPLIDVTQVT